MEQELPTLSSYLSKAKSPINSNDETVQKLAHSFEMQAHRLGLTTGAVLHKETALVLSPSSCTWIAPFRTIWDADDKDLSYLLVAGEHAIVLPAQSYKKLIENPITNFPPSIFERE